MSGNMNFGVWASLVTVSGLLGCDALPSQSRTLTRNINSSRKAAYAPSMFLKSNGEPDRAERMWANKAD